MLIHVNDSQIEFVDVKSESLVLFFFHFNNLIRLLLYCKNPEKD